ncbi:MAG: chromosome segregation protein SMC [Clostridiales bacterium]|nr:chromosome segregation protein SMC [Clostridiales bacterium]
MSLWAGQLGPLREQIVKAENDLVTAEEEIERASAASDRLYADIEELELERHVLEAEAERLRSDVSDRERRLGELGAMQSALRTTIENNQARASGIRGELEAQKSREDTVSQQIREREDRISAITSGRGSVLNAIGELENELGELISKAQAEERESLELSERERRLAVAIAEARALVSSLASQGQDLLDAETDAQTELAARSEERESALSERGEAKTEYDAAVNSAIELQNALKGYEMRVTSRREELSQLEEKAAKARGELGAAETRERALSDMERDFEGYSKAVRLVMAESSRGALKNIYGTVGGLVKTDDKYALAIETAFGAGIQNIIVRSEADGKAAIGALKRRDGGRATFLPLTVIRGARLNEGGLQSESGFEGLAIDLVTYDKKFENVYLSLLGRVAVAGTIDDAIRISKKYGAKFRLVTLDGQVINAGGSMTGGSAAHSSGIISRAGELLKLRTRIKALTAGAKAAEAAREECARKLKAAEFELESARAEKLLSDEKAVELRGELEAANRRVSVFDETIEGIKKRIEENREDLKQNGERIERERGNAALLEAELEQLQGQIAARGEKKSESEAERGKIARFISERRSEIAALDAEEEAVAKAMAELMTIRRDFEGTRTARMETADTLERENVSLGEELLKVAESDASIRAEIETRKTKMTELSERRLMLEQRRAELDRRSRGASQETMNLERERSRIEQVKTNREAEEKRIIDRLWNSYEMTRGEALSNFTPPGNISAANRRVNEVQNEISELGNPNIGAVEEFERLNTRYEFLTGQRDDAQNAKHELDAIIEEITQRMEEIFIAGFAEIEGKFAETFVELFGGGTAAVSLEDPDDVLGSGIEIVVQPPGKALKTITLLSGGERAFAAIALYFAILKTRPAPFVVLDEIEAALDDANVVRFSDYMRKMSAKTQMIIISHRRGTMEEADVLYGVTMPERGVSRIISLDLDDAEKTVNVRRV